jgi:hypothetical protein
MAQIDGKFLVDGYEAATRVVDFLSKTNRIFGCVHFFDVPSAPTRATDEVARIASPPPGNSSQCLNFLSFCSREAIANRISSERLLF